MEPELYDGFKHPEVWLNEVKTYCYERGIIQNGEIIEICKSMIHPSIKVSGNNFNEILNCLKEDISFIIYKNSVKRRFQVSEFDFTSSESCILTSLNQFRQFCYEGEINEIDEQKKLFLNILPKRSVHYNFINNNIDKINSMEDLIRYFNESVLDYMNIIKYGSCIVLRHAATGKYLSNEVVRICFNHHRHYFILNNTITNYTFKI
jgi:hypothetical protein